MKSFIQAPHRYYQSPPPNEQRKNMVHVKEDPESEARPGGRCDCRVKEEPAMQPPDVDFEFQAGYTKEESSTEAVSVKEEPSWGGVELCGVSSAAARAGLYLDHEVKGELVVGPECVQPRDVVYTLRAASAQSVNEGAKQKPECTRSKEQLLRGCYVRLERVSVPNTLGSNMCWEQNGDSSVDTNIDSCVSVWDTRLTLRGCCVRLERCDRLEYQRPEDTDSRLKNNIFECDTCGTRFQKKCGLLQHIRAHVRVKKNRFPKPYLCDVCGKQYTNHGLCYHKQMHAEKKAFSCALCNKQFRAPSDLIKHERTHTGEKPYPCVVCNKAFSELGGLKQHRRIHTGEKPYSCEICKKDFRCVTRFKEHKSVHTGERRYSCEVCNKKFRTSICLKIHTRLHTGEKPYTCTICSKKFIQSTHLRRHKLIHSDVKPFACGICKRTFKHMSYLRKHNTLHTGEKPYKCQICKKKFRESGTLKAHMRFHLGIKPYSCEICKKKFTQSSNLRSHRRKLHKS